MNGCKWASKWLAMPHDDPDGHHPDHARDTGHRRRHRRVKGRLVHSGHHAPDRPKDDTQVYKQFVENESFKRFVGDMVFAITSP